MDIESASESYSHLGYAAARDITLPETSCATQGTPAPLDCTDPGIEREQDSLTLD